MVYRSEHNCDKVECKKLTAHIRIDGNWTKIGHYGSECKKFELLDVQKEELAQLDRENRAKIDAEIIRVKQEGRARLKTIQNTNKSFFN